MEVRRNSTYPWHRRGYRTDSASSASPPPPSRLIPRPPTKVTRMSYGLTPGTLLRAVGMAGLSILDGRVCRTRHPTKRESCPDSPMVHVRLCAERREISAQNPVAHSPAANTSAAPSSFSYQVVAVGGTLPASAKCLAAFAPNTCACFFLFPLAKSRNRLGAAALCSGSQKTGPA